MSILVVNESDRKCDSLTSKERAQETEPAEENSARFNLIESHGFHLFSLAAKRRAKQSKRAFRSFCAKTETETETWNKTEAEKQNSPLTIKSHTSDLCGRRSLPLPLAPRRRCWRRQSGSSKHGNWQRLFSIHLASIVFVIVRAAKHN